MTEEEFKALKAKIENKTATPDEELQYLETINKGLDNAIEMVNSLKSDN